MGLQRVARPRSQRVLCARLRSLNVLGNGITLKGSGQGNEKIRFIFWGYLASVWRMKWRGTKAPRKLLEKFRQE